MITSCGGSQESLPGYMLGAALLTSTACGLILLTGFVVAVLVGLLMVRRGFWWLRRQRLLGRLAAVRERWIDVFCATVSSSRSSWKHSMTVEVGAVRGLP